MGLVIDIIIIGQKSCMYYTMNLTRQIAGITVKYLLYYGVDPLSHRTSAGRGSPNCSLEDHGELINKKVGIRRTLTKPS